MDPLSITVSALTLAGFTIKGISVLRKVQGLKHARKALAELAAEVCSTSGSSLPAAKRRWCDRDRAFGCLQALLLCHLLTYNH